MKIRIVNQSNNPLPAYETVNSAGMDLRAYLPEGPVTLESMQRGLVPTGLYMEIPKGYEGQVRPRSGLAIKSGITVLNSPGTIDADYRGQVCVILINLSDKPFVINSGDRIAQLIIAYASKLSRYRWKSFLRQNVGKADLDTQERDKR